MSKIFEEKMKIALKLTLPDGKVIVFTVHELLELAQAIIKTEYETCDTDQGIKPMDYGKHFHPEKLSNTKEWLAASKSLEQGISKEEKNKIKKNLRLYGATLVRIN